jgi:hypothetical protein
VIAYIREERSRWTSLAISPGFTSWRGGLPTESRLRRRCAVCRGMDARSGSVSGPQARRSGAVGGVGSCSVHHCAEHGDCLRRMGFSGGQAGGRGGGDSHPPAQGRCGAGGSGGIAGRGHSGTIGRDGSVAGLGEGGQGHEVQATYSDVVPVLERAVGGVAGRAATGEVEGAGWSRIVALRELMAAIGKRLGSCCIRTLRGRLEISRSGN